MDGSAPPRQLTATPGAESGAHWCPDGTKLAFSAKRGGDEDPPQIHVMDMRGPGKAVAITDLCTGATNPVWSPDGLQRMQVPSRLLVFHDANHWIMNGSEARYIREKVHAWLAAPLAGAAGAEHAGRPAAPGRFGPTGR